MIAPDCGCNRSYLVVRDINEVLEFAVPSVAEKAPDPGEEGAMEEKSVPRVRMLGQTSV
jgi:hypothetical protein